VQTKSNPKPSQDDLVSLPNLPNFILGAFRVFSNQNGSKTTRSKFQDPWNQNLASHQNNQTWFTCKPTQDDLVSPPNLPNFILSAFVEFPNQEDFREVEISRLLTPKSNNKKKIKIKIVFQC